MAPLSLLLLVKNRKGSKDFYKILNNLDEPVPRNKWNIALNRNIPKTSWTAIYKACFNTVKDNYLIYLQFKIINRILGTKSLLYKISLTDSPLCTFCKKQEETILHLFYDCNEVLLLWQTLYQWISTKLNTQLRPEKNSILLGYIEPYINIPLNTVNMVT